MRRMEKNQTPRVHYNCQNRRRLISRCILRWCCVWIAGGGATTTTPLLFANGMPVVVASDATAGDSTAKAETYSFDFIVSGAQDRLKGLSVASVRADEDATDEESGANDAGGEMKPMGIAVVNAPDSDIGVHRDDHIVAVNGVPLSPLSLSDWIKASSVESDAAVAATARSASSPSPSPSPFPHQGTSRTAMLPLVDAPDTLLRRPEGFFVFPPPSQASSENNCRLATAGSNSSALCSSTQADPPMRDGARTAQAGGLGSPLLTGFLRVEVVELPGAEVTFRPGEARRVELIRQREEEAEAAERRERDRLVAEEKALLESRQKKQEEKAAVAMNRARAGASETDERAREQQTAAEKEKLQEEERRVSREQEAAAKVAKKSKEEFARMRKEGNRFTFTAVYKEVALPMGLAFDRVSPLAVVSEVVAGGSSEAAGVRVGDHLVRVNDHDTSELKPAMTIKLLQQAEWPRVLTFSAPETEASDGDDEPLLLDLVVAEPAIARGAYLMQAPRGWGSLVEERRLGRSPWSCEPRPMMLADPALACQQDLRLSAEENEFGGGDPSTAIVLVKRGVCTFVEKAKNVQLAIQRLSEKQKRALATSSAGDRTSAVAMPGGVTTAVPPGNASNFGAAGQFVSGRTGGMVLLNGDDALVDMPAGNLVTDDVRISVAMTAVGTNLARRVSQRNGSSVEALLSWGVEVRAAIVPVGACPFQDTSVDAEGARVRKDGDDGGLFRAHSKSAGAADFDYRQAHYGPGVVGVAGGAPRGIAVADPLDGCDDRAYRVRVSVMFAAMERGRCSFNMKTLAAQRAGAVGVIIINTAETTVRAMADRGDGQKATIPTVMVSAKAGRWLLAHAAERDRSPILARFVRESFDAERG